VQIGAPSHPAAEQLPHEFVWELFELLPDLQLHPLPRSAPTWLQEPRRSLPPLLGPPPPQPLQLQRQEEVPEEGGTRMRPLQ
jgi:hypothetical protein